MSTDLAVADPAGMVSKGNRLHEAKSNRNACLQGDSM
jgi:hypothetical protein